MTLLFDWLIVLRICDVLLCTVQSAEENNMCSSTYCLFNAAAIVKKHCLSKPHPRVMNVFEHCQWEGYRIFEQPLYQQHKLNTSQYYYHSKDR